MKEGRFEPDGAATPRRRRSAPGRRATMLDVANEARVSQTTVSLVLNHADGARLSAETRKRVLQAASRIGYQPVRRGAAPATAATAVGFLCDELSTDPWTAIALDAVREKAWERGLTVVVMATRGDADMEAAALAQLGQQPLAGLIYATINTRLVDPPAAVSVPLVLLNCHVADGSLPSVTPGEVGGGHAATDHLIAAGHRRIGYVNGEASMEAARHRLRGYKQALATADLPVDPALIREGAWQPLSGYEAARALMALPSPPTAIFCANDLMALGAYEALRELGLRIPDDVAVMGYDDREIAQHLHPPLSTVLLPHYEMAAIAAEWLFDLADGAEMRPRQIKVECPVVKRGSA